MELPPRTDPRWRALVQGKQTFALKGLATRMLVTRVRLLGSRKDPGALDDALDTAFEYFSKNLEVASADLATIFGASQGTSP